MVPDRFFETYLFDGSKVFEEVDPSDEAILDTGKLPFEIEPEVLYVYDESCDETKPLESIQLKDVIDIVVKKKAADEQNYRFLLDLGEKKITLLSNNITEMTKWVKAIQAARANVKEKSKSKLQTVKNMYWHFKILADEGEEKLKEKINLDYEKLTSSGEIMRADNIKDLIKIQENAANEFIAVINACLAHKDQRVDVIRLYVDIFHESIMNALRVYFRRNQETLENKDVFELVKFLIWYGERLRIFGDAFVDEKMIKGIDTLCKIVGRRILRSNMKTAKNMLTQEIEREPEIDGRGRAATSAPSDIFRLINETFHVLTYCNTKELSLALLETCSHTLQYFSNGLGYLIENSNLTVDHLIAFCNNTLIYMNNVKDFAKQAEQLTGADKEQIQKYYDESIFNRAFIAQGKRAYLKIADKLLIQLNEQWSIINFLDINLVQKEKSVKESMQKVTQIMDKVHSNFTSKIEGACLEKIVACYVQSFLNSAEKKKIRPEDFKKLINKLEDDTKLLSMLFSNLKKSVVDSAIGPINNFFDFLTTNFVLLSISVQNMKEQYGNSIKWTTIELLIKVRNDELSKEDRADLFKSCEEIYRNTQKKPEKSSNFNVFKLVDQDFDNSELNKLSLERSDSSSSFIDDDSSDSGRSSRSSSVISQKSSMNIEGYLEVDNNEFLSGVGGTLLSNLKFEYKYFNLKRDVLYFYKEKSSETSQGSYKLKDMVDSGTFETDHTMFFITLKVKEVETKTIRFRTSKPEKRDIWLESIREASKLGDYGAMVELNASEVTLFTDTRSLFTEIEKMPDLEFTLKPPPRDAKASILSTTTDRTQTDMEGSRRKRSFDLNEKVPERIPAPQEQGCIAKLCGFLGGSKPNQNDYRPL